MLNRKELFCLLYLFNCQVVISDQIFINAKVYLGQRQFASAFIVDANRFAYVGSNEEALKLRKSSSKIIDLHGKTVIPGLIDSHIHAIRAGLNHSHEISLEGTRSIKEALHKIQRESKLLLPHQWIVIAGGWSELQFKERRRFTYGELESASNGHPFYVQLNYSAVLLSRQAFSELQLIDQVELLSNLIVETLPNGRPSGWLLGSSRAISRIFDLLPLPNFSEQKRSTLLFFNQLLQYGVTGVIDPGGYNIKLGAYEPILQLNRESKLKLRVRFHICAPSDGAELEDFRAIVANPQFNVSSSFLKFNGIGENVTWSMYNNDSPTAEQKDHLFNVLSWAAESNLPVTLHWNNNQSVHHLLDVLRQVHALHNLSSLRWSIAHLMDASAYSISEMGEMGIGWLVQDAFYFTGRRYLSQHGIQDASSIPRIIHALERGLHIGAGTDAHRVMSYNPFVSLEWLLDGKTVDGLVLGDANERPDRFGAIDLYTLGSAWFTFEEHERGQIKPGFLADAVVLDRDFFTVPLHQISSIRPLMTLVDGKVAYQRKGLSVVHSR